MTDEAQFFPFLSENGHICLQNKQEMASLATFA